MSNPGIRVISRGDINTVPPKDQLYSSEFQSLKVTRPFKGTFTTDANGYGQDFPSHKLAYRPVAFAFYRLAGKNWEPVDNMLVGIQTNILDFVIESGGSTSPEWTNAVVEYKAWLMLDPAQDIL